MFGDIFAKYLKKIKINLLEFFKKRNNIEIIMALIIKKSLLFAIID